MLGGKKEVSAAANDLQVEELANYAVNEHNNRQVCSSLLVGAHFSTHFCVSLGFSLKLRF